MAILLNAASRSGGIPASATTFPTTHPAGATVTDGVDMTATVDADKGPEVGLLEKVDPRATERIVLVYDVPRGTTAQAVELHSALSSDGATVALPGARGLSAQAP